jgi:hypothetical protein
LESEGKGTLGRFRRRREKNIEIEDFDQEMNLEAADWFFWIKIGPNDRLL